MKKILLRSTASFLLLFPTLLLAQTQTNYTVSFPNLVHHEAEITAEFTGVPAEVLEVRMARSSPGRYALHEFAKNVYAVKATNSKGETLKITRPNLHQWNVTGHNGTVKITYTLFADRPDGTYAAVDETHAHLNAPATFMYAPVFDQKPSFVKFEIPAGKNWTIATQLKPETAKNTFSAPSFQYLMDSPVKIADFMWREWPVQENGKTQTIRFALHHNGSAAEFDKYVEDTKKMVQEAKDVFGELPAFDFGTYTFIGCYMPHAAGDGMEHRNSTILTSSRPLKTHAKDNLGTVSHEFFHAWNVERIRPQNLEPFNFADANSSDALWFAEGFTNYYGDLLLCRSGLLSVDDYAKVLSNNLNNFLLLPGKDLYSPAEMSRQAPFVDAARSVDNTNRLNTFVSYYTHGDVLALALDLTLRSEFAGISLDDYMRAIWQKYGKTQKPYVLKDLEQTLAELTKNESFASEFFQKYVYGHAPIDFNPLLKNAGLELRPEKPNEASLGFAPLSFASNRATMQAGSLRGSPLYQAGLENEDVLLKLDGKKITSAKTLQNILKKHKPGNKVTLEFMQRSQVKTATVTLIENPDIEVVSTEKTGKTLSESAKKLRDNWLK
ncbi:M61 family metallopeptidase [Adhaeribacter sp. BT258]|uniref:M61 family metallopeptidase n=1 Tax=Adhaeribacter terrigena TaxID=2793070 RepID=A0ABS1BY02_9BACT|nr:PDZ domain-containing protein [Adhaeribacter terrigena]MBK0402043.1 M61 family metallopeptidase [Adhaeribacter terrigena]